MMEKSKTGTSAENNPMAEYLKETVDTKSDLDTKVYEETDRPIVKYLNKEENQGKIIFSHLLKHGERIDADFVSVIKQSILNLKELHENGSVDNLRVQIESSLIALHDATEWVLSFDHCTSEAICLEDKNTSDFKMQIPIRKITGIIISK